MRLGARHLRKLSDQDVENLLSSYRAGATLPVLARRYGIDHSSVYYWIKKGNTPKEEHIENKNTIKVQKEYEAKMEHIRKNKKYIYADIVARIKKPCTHSEGAKIRGKCFICQTSNPQ